MNDIQSEKQTEKDYFTIGFQFIMGAGSAAILIYVGVLAILKLLLMITYYMRGWGW